MSDAAAEVAKIAIAAFLVVVVGVAVGFFWLSYLTGRVVEVVQMHQAEIESLRRSRHDVAQRVTRLSALVEREGREEMHEQGT